MPHIYLLTDHRYVAPATPDRYVQQILDEDILLSDALSTHGITTERVNWSDSSVDWDRADAAVFRTIWDYFMRFEEFDPWLARVAKRIQLINPLSLIRWNMDKHYLRDLSQKGFPIVPSIFIEQGDSQSLEDHFTHSGWDEVILKPCISGAARHTYRLRSESIAEHEEVFAALIAKESMMLQEFHTSVLAQGEASHMVMGGNYTHSILKRSKGDDFRVQDDFGGTVHHYEATATEKALAEAVFASCDPMPIYGRLDILWDEAGEPMISELEIIEPELWMRTHPSAAEAFAKGIKQALD